MVERWGVNVRYRVACDPGRIGVIISYADSELALIHKEKVNELQLTLPCTTNQLSVDVQ